MNTPPLTIAGTGFMQTTVVQVIDPDFRRRAVALRSLAAPGIHVEPIDDVSQLSEIWPSEGVLLIYDSGTALRDLNARLGPRLPRFGVIAYSDEADTDRVVSAMLDGASDYKDWPIEPADLQRAVRQSANRQTFVGRVRWRCAAARKRLAALTAREREVLDHVSEGLTNREIGQRLSLSARTVEIHRLNALKKLGDAGTVGAVRLAVEAALVA
jgi:FixJ family two-component response regulator